MRARRPRISRTAQRTDKILAAVTAVRDVVGGIRFDLEIIDGNERVPGTLLVPRDAVPAPAALLLHGFGSRKERMIDTIGEALLARGVAALSMDLPLHGDRAGSPNDLRATSPMALLAAWRGAMREARVGLEYLASHPDVDPARLAIVGYSLGSFLANIVAADVESVRAVVLAASGDLPEGLQFESMIRGVLDPLRGVRRLAGRPLLMINGRFDRTVKPSQGERLFAAAHEPKTMRWYGGGHWPPAREIEFAAEWLAGQLNASPHRSRTTASTSA